MAQLVSLDRKCPQCGALIAASLSRDSTNVTCSQCRAPLIFPGIARRKHSFAWRPQWLRNLGFSFTVSMSLHLILIGALWFIVLEPQIIPFDFVTTLIRDVDDGRFESLGFLVDPAEPSMDRPDAAPMAAFDAIESIGLDKMGGAGDEVSLGGFSGNGTIGTGRPVEGGGTGNPDIAAGFSDIAAGRLSRHASVKQGAYEIALFWNGPSDLDVHVLYQSSEGNARRLINYVHMGKPGTGFLDLDQNADEPYTDEPIEHVRWKPRKPPNGFYTVLVHGFELRSRGRTVPDRVSYVVEIKTPDGVKSYRGTVAQDGFSYVETLTMGRVTDQSLTAEAQAARLVETANSLIVPGSEDAQWAPGLLRLVTRQFPKSDAAQQALEHLRKLGRQ